MGYDGESKIANTHGAFHSRLALVPLVLHRVVNLWARREVDNRGVLPADSGEGEGHAHTHLSHTVSPLAFCLPAAICLSACAQFAFAYISLSAGRVAQSLLTPDYSPVGGRGMNP